MLLKYGKREYFIKDINKERVICPYCNEATVLESYTATKCAHIYHIPIFPLVKYRNIDYCPKCNKGIRYRYKDWKEIKKRGMKISITNYLSNTNRAEATINLHHAYCLFESKKKSELFALRMEDTFLNNVDIHSYLAKWYLDNGVYWKATEHYRYLYDMNIERAYHSNILAKLYFEIDDYESSAYFYQEKEATLNEQDLTRLKYITERICKNSQSKKIKEKLAQVDDYYKNFPYSPDNYRHELLINEINSNIEKGQYKKRDVIKTIKRVALSAFIVTLLIIINIFNYGKQQLYISNSLSKKAIVTINEHKTFTVFSNEIISRPLTEGKYNVTIEVEELPAYSLEIKIKNNFLYRLYGKNIFLLNIKGATIFQLGQVEYIRNIKKENIINNKMRLITGDEFVTLRNIDFILVPPPQKLKYPANYAQGLKYFIKKLNIENNSHGLSFLHENSHMIKSDLLLKYMKGQIETEETTEEFKVYYSKLKLKKESLKTK